MTQTKYAEILKELSSITFSLAVLSQQTLDEFRCSQSPLDAQVFTTLRDCEDSLRARFNQLDMMIGPCERHGHRWSKGVCLKCGEPVDAYAAARKEAR